LPTTGFNRVSESVHRLPQNTFKPRAVLFRLRPLIHQTVAVLLLAACSGTDAPVAPTVEPTPPVVTLAPSAGKLPMVSIRTASGTAIVSKLIYVNATMTVVDSAGVTLFDGPLEIRGRGNSTWEMPKKPYRLRLTSSASLLGMPASRHWALLANFSDKTLLRNELAFRFSEMLGMPWTPRARSVDVQVNGEYLGVYQLVETIRIAPDRVNITSLRAADTTAAAITGGYLIEVDERRGESFCFNSTITQMVFCLADPDALLDADRAPQRAYIQRYIAQTDSAIFGADFADPAKGYAAFIDVASLVDFHIMQEIVKNVDGSMRFSTYMYKPRGGKLVMGPVWDFDLAFGNVNYDNADLTTGWHNRRTRWYARLFEDPAFKARVVSRWNELSSNGSIARFQKLIFERANYMNVVQARNFERWPILNTYVWPNRVVMGSYDGEVIAMNGWLLERIRWMNAEIGR
jgi:hypothetical protein